MIGRVLQSFAARRGWKPPPKAGCAGPVPVSRRRAGRLAAAAGAFLALGCGGPARAEATVRCAAFSPDGRTLASGWSDGEVRLVDLRTGRTRATLPAGAGVGVLAFSRDGRLLATSPREGADEVRIWDTGPARLRQTLRGKVAEIHQLLFSPDGRRLAAAVEEIVKSPDGRSVPSLLQVQLWNTATGAREATLPRARAPLLFTPDGRTLVTGRTTDASEWHELGQFPVVLWDVAARRARSVLPGEVAAANELALAPDGSFLVTGGLRQPVRIWDPRTGELLRTLPGSAGHVLALAPDGSALVTGAARGDLLLWDPRSDAPRAQLVGAALGPTFSADGRVLLTAGTGTELQVWDGRTGQRRQTLRYQRAGDGDLGVTTALSPDGRLAAAGGPFGRLRLWDIAQGKLLTERDPPPDDLRFSPDSSTLAVYGYYELRLFDVRRPGRMVELALSPRPPPSAGGRPAALPPHSGGPASGSRPARRPVLRDRPAPRVSRPAAPPPGDRFIFY